MVLETLKVLRMEYQKIIIQEFMEIFFPHSLGIFLSVYDTIYRFLRNMEMNTNLWVYLLSGENKFEDKLLNLVDYKNLYYKLNLDYFRHQNENLQTHDSNGDIIYNDLYLKKN